MRIALVADVKHKLILWRIEHIVQCYRCFYKSEVRTYVSAMLANTIEHSLTHFVGYNIKCRDVHAFQVGRTLYLLYIHRLLIDLFVLTVSRCKDTNIITLMLYHDCGIYYHYFYIFYAPYTYNKGVI